MHRDLKPANVLLGEDGSIKIADFGIARLESSDLTADGSSLGSPAYMSPEQITGGRVDGRSDLFSLGVVIYQMLSGKRPFAGPGPSEMGYQIVHEKPAPLAGSIATLWKRVVARLLAKSPDGRYPGATALLEDLRTLAALPRERSPRTDDHDVDATVVEGSTSSSGGFDRGRAVELAVQSLSRIAAGAVALGVRGASLTQRSIREAASDPATRRKALFGVAGVFGIVLLTGTLALVLGAGCRVEVEMKHGLEAGRLRIEVDGREVVDRRFKGEPRATRVFGREMLKRTEGTLTDSFVIDPGEHDITVHVKASGRDDAWSRTIRKTIPRDGAARLKVRVATSFSRGLRLDWSATGRER